MDAKLVATYVEAWRRRFSQIEEEARSCAESVRHSLGEVVRILRKHGARRIILFGSLCSGSFHSKSDIDLAVEGIPSSALTRAFADLMMALDRPVDLKPLEELEPPFREHVLSTGTTLYEEA